MAPETMAPYYFPIIPEWLGNCLPLITSLGFFSVLQTHFRINHLVRSLIKIGDHIHSHSKRGQLQPQRRGGMQTDVKATTEEGGQCRQLFLHLVGLLLFSL